MDRDFKGIWIPKEVWLDSNLTNQEKLFYVEIDSLDGENGCFASNSYFSEFFEISTTRVSLVINNLVKKGYVKSNISYKKGTQQILKRVLNICYRPYTTKVKDPIQQKLIDNNTNINNTTNNKYILEEFEIFWAEYDKKVSRKKTTDKYISLKKKNKLPDISEHVQTIRAWHGTDKWKGGYQPNPLTWLNGELWNDELPEEKKLDISAKQPEDNRTLFEKLKEQYS